MQCAKRLRSNKSRSRPQLITAVGGTASRPWQDSGLKLAKYHATGFTSKNTVVKAVLVVFFSWCKSLDVAEATKEANY